MEFKGIIKEKCTRSSIGRRDSLMAREKLPINETDSGCLIPEDRRPIPDDR